MARAIRVVSVERGYDPREFVLVAFGGAGALHAVSVAKDLGIHTVMIPSNQGVLCAVGLLVSDIRSDYVKTSISNFLPENIGKMNANFKELTDKGDEWLNTEKIDEAHKVIIRHADMRYYGQNFELSIEIPFEEITIENIGEIENLFHQAHKREYGYCNEGALVQIVNYRATALGKVQTIKLVEHELEGEDSTAAIKEVRDVYFEETQGYVETKIYDRDLLKAGNVLQGPAIIEQMDATIVVPPGHTAKADRYLNLMISY